MTTPSKITFVLNEQCNLRCRHCYCWKTGERRVLSTALILDTLAQLNDWLDDYKLFFTGGEPTLREDLPQLVEAGARGASLVSMTTNGSRVDDALAGQLAAAGLGHVDVALDSLDAATHDRLRGRAGAHERAVAALQAFAQTGISVNVAAVVNAGNVGQLPALACWVERRGMGKLLLQPIMPPFWSDRDHAWLRRSELWPQDPRVVEQAFAALVARKTEGAPIDNDVEQLLEMAAYLSEPPLEPLERVYPKGPPRPLEPGEVPQVIELQAGDPAGELPPLPDGPLDDRLDRCVIGWRVLNINPYGDVRLCHDMPPIGNLLNQSVREMWDSERAETLRERIACCHEGCYLLNCNFCD